MKKFLCFAFLSFLCACSSSTFYNLNDVKNQLEVSEFPGQNDYEDADAIILKEEHEVDIKLDSDYGIETTETTHILKKLLKNIEDNSEVEIYIDSEDKLTDISAKTIKPDGTEVVLSSSDFHTSTGQGTSNSFYTDDKTVKFTFPSIEKNCFVEYKFSILKRYSSVFSRWRIQKRYPILYNSYKLTAPILLLTPRPNGAGWKFQYRPYNCEVETPDFVKNMAYTKSEKDLNVSFTWVKKDIPALVLEPLMPPYDDLVQFVQFSRSEWKEWSDVSKWYYVKYFSPQMLITPTIKDKATSLTAGCTDELSKLKNIYSFVQKIRYISIKLGEGGGIRPNFPETILQRQYGDCKDKSMLLISLLKSINIKASPVLVLTADEGSIDTDFPSFYFNHMITKVILENGRSYFLDPTAEFCPVGELPSACENINVLSIDDSGLGKLEKTPGSSYSQNIRDLSAKVTINDNYEAVFNISYIYHGEYDMIYRNVFKDKTPEELKKYCKSLVVDDFLNAEILNCAISNRDSLNKPLTLTFDVKTKDIINKQGDLIFMNVDPFKYSFELNWLSRTERKYNIEFSCPYTINKTIEIKYPKNLSIRNLPTNIDISGLDAQYQKLYTQTEPNTLTLNEKISFKSKTITPDKYSKFRKTFENLQSKSNEKIVFTSK